MKFKNILGVSFLLAVFVSVRACALVDSTAVVMDTTGTVEVVAFDTDALSKGMALMSWLESQAEDEQKKDSAQATSKKVKKSKLEGKYDKTFFSKVAENEAVGVCMSSNDKNMSLRIATDEARAQLAEKLKVEKLVGCEPVQSKVIYIKEKSVYKAYVKVRKD